MRILNDNVKKKKKELTRQFWSQITHLQNIDQQNISMEFKIDDDYNATNNIKVKEKLDITPKSMFTKMY